MFVCLYSGDEHILVVYIFQLPQLTGVNTITTEVAHQLIATLCC